MEPEFGQETGVGLAGAGSDPLVSAPPRALEGADGAPLAGLAPHARALTDAEPVRESARQSVKVQARAEAPVTRVEARAFRIPTDAPESDGTYEWTSTTLVLVEVEAGGARGVGYTYADAATAALVRETLAGIVEGMDAFDVPAAWAAMVGAIRNLGRPGIASTAISAVDAALWDVKGRALGLPVTRLLGRARDRVQLYGSGGFTSYGVDRLVEQLGGWAAEGFSRVKMKVGREPSRDVDRARAVRAAIGRSVELFVDANGAYDRKQALWMAEKFAELDVRWFEEPVSSDDLAGLRLMRDRAPAPMEIAAGEYGYDAEYFRRMLEAGAVDVLQADGTRCGGITGFLRVAALADAFGIALSAHCAPALHVAPACAAPRFAHCEYFHDHVRIERTYFDGTPRPVDGTLAPDPSRPGLGLDPKRADLDKFAV